MDIQELREKARKRESGIVFVGYGRKYVNGWPTKQVGVTVGVRKKLSPQVLKEQDIVPHQVGGERTDVIEVGDIRACSAAGISAPPIDRTDRYRPIFGGVSFGHFAITAGTLGAVMLKGGQPVIVTNNHVGANTNDAEIGDHGLQPGPFDGGTEEDYVSRLLWYEPIRFFGEGSNCPLAGAVTQSFNHLAKLLGRKTRLLAFSTEVPVNVVDVSLHVPVVEYRHAVYGITGDVRMLEVRDPIIDDLLIKSGRTTKTTTGHVLAVDGTMNVNMGEGRVAVFEQQVLTEHMCEGGDSGSIGFKHRFGGIDSIAGLLFAGSPQVSAFNPFSAVVRAAGLDYDVD